MGKTHNDVDRCSWGAIKVANEPMLFCGSDLVMYEMADCEFLSPIPKF